VTDAGAVFSFGCGEHGAVFSFGCGEHGALGHNSLNSEVLPRRIDALTQMGRRFVAVAAGSRHALALTDDGQLYGWGDMCNGHGQTQHTPQLVTALAGQRVLLVYAHDCSSCAVTENGKLYTWGQFFGNSAHLGHGVDDPQ